MCTNDKILSRAIEQERELRGSKELLPFEWFTIGLKTEKLRPPEKNGHPSENMNSNEPLIKWLINFLPWSCWSQGGGGGGWVSRGRHRMVGCFSGRVINLRCSLSLSPTSPLSFFNWMHWKSIEFERNCGGEPEFEHSMMMMIDRPIDLRAETFEAWDRALVRKILLFWSPIYNDQNGFLLAAYRERRKRNHSIVFSLSSSTLSIFLEWVSPLCVATRGWWAPCVVHRRLFKQLGERENHRQPIKRELGGRVGEWERGKYGTPFFPFAMEERGRERGKIHK